ncbi:MAG: molybdopterin-binding protein [Rickettsiales bacterium]
MHNKDKTASIIVIGDEILSGRTQETNVAFIAKHLSEMGIKLSEVRIIPDESDVIQKTVLELKEVDDYIFTTGGIGPTHDDITTESIAKAFNRKLETNEEAFELMSLRCKELDIKMNDGTKKMAILPEKVKIIANNVSAAPGFQIENVFVFAGIPNIMQNMFLNIRGALKSSSRFYSKSLFVIIGESHLAPTLQELQEKYSAIAVGSYPSQMSDGRWSVTVVLRGKDNDKVESAFNALRENLNIKNIESKEV